MKNCVDGALYEIKFMKINCVTKIKPTERLDKIFHYCCTLIDLNKSYTDKKNDQYIHTLLWSKDIPNLWKKIFKIALVQISMLQVSIFITFVARVIHQCVVEDLGHAEPIFMNVVPRNHVFKIS